MHAFIMATAFLFAQEATSAPSATTLPATIHQMVDVRVQMIGLKQGFEIPEQISNHEEFLADAKTKENILWTTDFRGSTVAGHEFTLATTESSPMSTGVSRTANSTVQQISYQQTGTTVRLMPKLEADDRIHLMVNIKASRMHFNAPDGPGEVAALPPSLRELLLETEVILKSGQTKTLSSSPTNSDPRRPAEQALVLITAKPAAE